MKYNLSDKLKDLLNVGCISRKEFLALDTSLLFVLKNEKKFRKSATGNGIFDIIKGD